MTIETECAACAARNRGICGALAPDRLAELGRIGRRRRIARGQILMWEGDEARTIANVREGVLKLSAATPDGREQIVGLAWQGDLVGRPFGERIGFTVTALSDAEVCLFTRAEFEAFAGANPQFERALLRRALADLDRARDFMLLLGRKSASQRVAALLLDISRRCSAGTRIDLPMRRQEMADVLGLTIETISRQLSRMSEDGLIALPDRRSVVLTGRARLEALAAA